MHLVVHVLNFRKQSFFDSLMNNLFKIETFCSIIKAFIVTFDQLNASLISYWAQTFEY